MLEFQIVEFCKSYCESSIIIYILFILAEVKFCVVSLSHKEESPLYFTGKLETTKKLRITEFYCYSLYFRLLQKLVSFSRIAERKKTRVYMFVSAFFHNNNNNSNNNNNYCY